MSASSSSPQSVASSGTQVQVIAIQPGMKCALGGHAVRVESVNPITGMADVHSVADPTLKGPARLSDLSPIACNVQTGDQVTVYTGQNIPVVCVVMDTEGEYALFFSSVYGEKIWMHTSHIVSVRPNFRQLANK